MTDEQIRQVFEKRSGGIEEWVEPERYWYALEDFTAGYKAALASLEQVGYQIRGGKMNERLLQPWEYELVPEVQKWKSCCESIYRIKDSA